MRAPDKDYADGGGNALTLRGSLTLGARAEYARTLAGESGPAAATREDAEQRALELLFERLAVRWTIAPRGGGRPEGHTLTGIPCGHTASTQAAAPIDGQRELVERLRAASAEERAWVRGVLREHCAEHFPDVKAP